VYVPAKIVVDENCICPNSCDCADPEPENGVALLSNLCPEHNWNPYPMEDCPAKNHRNGALASES
jgi:hypothetical protein